MNDEEIMKKFNETFGDSGQNSLKTNSESVSPYKAVSINNQNVQNFNVPSSSQEQKLDIKDLMSTDNNTYFPNPSNVVDEQKNSIDPPKYTSNVNYNYVSTYNNSKPKKSTIKLTQENIIFIVIIFTLFVFILIIPTIYDFVRQIKMK